MIIKEVRLDGVWFLALLQIPCVTVGISLNVSVPYFPSAKSMCD